jgi:hypothetical protein
VPHRAGVPEWTQTRCAEVADLGDLGCGSLPSPLRASLPPERDGEWITLPPDQPWVSCSVAEDTRLLCVDRDKLDTHLRLFLNVMLFTR